ncbi:ABC transporter permease [Bacillus horti]|uniref:ABC transport system permease protein n=1 Tax=Caldalkalibacillus horti TaxID=77523 RepID=A0ABT9W3V6_9BACI|nr:ABC transporter permease [Bacillus horti]MDQ0167934.1 putative ABC transport system permease protein [Bacillus horti]
MLAKLSFLSMRKMLKDYIVLLFGLTISISIFYMFQTLSLNRDFIEGNSLINSIGLVFNVGTFILAFITFFYIFYATSFILSLRQKELGMYMMLGAKKPKVTQLVFFETVTIGIISIVIGLLVGSGLANGVAGLLMAQLGFSAEGFKPVFIPSIVTTVIFYMILFFLTAFVNATKLARKSVLANIKADEQVEEVPKFGTKTFLAAILGLILLGIGYSCLIFMEQLREIGLILGAVCTTAGTYLVFMSLLPVFVASLKKRRGLNEKGLNSFTLAQLRFRVKSLSRVLGTVAMLVALGVGAIAGGFAFHHNVETMTVYFKANDIVLYAPTEEDERLLNEMNIVEQHEYRLKVDEEAFYLLKDDLLASPPMIYTYADETDEEPVRLRVSEPLSDSEYALWDYSDDERPVVPNEWSIAIGTELNFYSPMFNGRDVFILDQELYDSEDGSEQVMWVVNVDRFSDYLPQLRVLDERQEELAKELSSGYFGWLGSKYSSYINTKAISVGTIFMGFFLGIAFLMMMASVLMFKLLSDASKDIKRYAMLRKIGVRKKVLVRSIYKEMLFVFTFPALLGLLHVLIGMNMFSFIIIDPYAKIWIPIVLFLGIYSLYYFVTVQLYKGIVLPKKE